MNSLLYFKKAFPTEIILVDTGCNAEQRALAEKYADRIIDFTWCDDLAAARNVGLKKRMENGSCIWMTMNGLKIRRR